MRVVLLVDDDHLLTEIVCSAVLRDDRFVCIPTHSGEEALVLLELEPPDVMILDLVMPHIDGMAVLRATPPTVKTIVLTAIGDQPAAVYEAQHAGARMILPKPLNPDELLDAVITCIKELEEDGL